MDAGQPFWGSCFGRSEAAFFDWLPNDLGIQAALVTYRIQRERFLIPPGNKVEQPITYFP
ncbi:hypothetical protein ADIS_4432 [Lunatimonas lonarensis]|uniref:Uncharacterized protein n=1 Tax=Lunatimonas lonarensis TaxID=1232681 RepID=R7ZMD3_9BACT|nr:hypothetical protein ADIS_4432 [Lunatimonas lonarensis]